jgi:transcriptional regulator with XRE-family HTH domain
MIDVVIRLENVTGPDGRPVDEHEGDVLAEGLRAVTAGLLAKMAYTADAAKVARQAVPADVVGTLHQFEQGRDNPTLDRLQRMARLYGLRLRITVEPLP